jgi:hypothetical protein
MVGADQELAEKKENQRSLFGTWAFGSDKTQPDPSMHQLGSGIV